MNATKRKASSVTSTKGNSGFNDLSTDYRSSGENSPPTHGEMLASFRQSVIENIGFAPSAIEASGKLERFSSNGKHGDLSGWYVLHFHGDFAVGVFGCWRSGIKQTWHSANGSQRLSDAEWQTLKKAIAQAKQQAATEKAAEAEQAHRQAVNLWQTATPANPAHPYLKRKQVGAYGIQQSGNLLLIPLCDLDGTLHSVQTIDTDGNKRFLAGTPKRGKFHLIGDTLTHPQGVYLCEGYATGASLYEAYHLPVLVCFDAGNLLPVAQAYRARFPQVKLTVCADNDRKTPATPA